MQILHRIKHSKINLVLVVFQVIGGNNVAVPTHLFKVMIAITSDGQQHIGAFKVPNVPLYDAELSDLSVSISELESSLGIHLFPELKKDIKNATDSSLTTPFFPAEYRKRKMIVI